MKGSTIESIATAAGSTVQQAVDLTLENANIPNAGFERKVVGTAFATGVNKISKPIEGSVGVYVVRPTVIAKAPALPNYKTYVDKLKPQVAGYSGRVIPALKDEADIEDNRAKFNY
jgi:peptidyl-prolyl cis-trans isomerase D